MKILIIASMSMLALTCTSGIDANDREKSARSNNDNRSIQRSRSHQPPAKRVERPARKQQGDLRQQRRENSNSRQSIRENHRDIKHNQREIRQHQQNIRENRKDIRQGQGNSLDNRRDIRNSQREIRDSQSQIRNSQRDIRQDRHTIHENRNTYRDSNSHRKNLRLPDRMPSRDSLKHRARYSDRDDFRYKQHRYIVNKQKHRRHVEHMPNQLRRYKHGHYRGSHRYGNWHRGHNHYHYDYRYRNLYNSNHWYDDYYYHAYFNYRWNHYSGVNIYYNSYMDPYYCPDDFADFVATLAIGALIFSW